MRSLLICAAVDEELAALPQGLRSREGVYVAALGIGPVEAALGASEAFAARRYDAAILLGTCGALPFSNLTIGDVVAIERSVLTSSDAAAGFAYVPTPMQKDVFSNGALLDTMAPGVRRVGCATVVAITRDLAHAEAEARATGCQVEHLEAHAFLRAAERAGVPAFAVLGVANHVGPNAHREWLEHGHRAAAAAVEALAL